MERLTERNPSWIDDELWERACEPDCEEIDAVYRKLKDYEDAEEHGLLLRLPISEDAPVYSIEYCCGNNKSNRSGMCFRGFCENCSDKAYYIRESVAKLIWENDILSGHIDDEFPEDETRKRVVWHENGWCTNEPGCDYYEELDDFDSENFEVIGNMIDNPELLEV